MTTLCKKLFGWATKKKPYIRFYSVFPGVADLFPIVKASSFDRPGLQKDKYPDNVLPTSNCPGIKRFAGLGWVITAPADFEISTIGDKASFSWREPMVFGKGQPGTEAYISSHPTEQAAPIIDDLDTTVSTVVKVETPWRIEASDDIVFLQVPMSYNNESRFVAASGVLDPRFSHAVNIQLFWKQLEGTTLVRAGTPLCQYIPVLRKDLNHSEFDVSVEEANENDFRREIGYNYAANCVMLATDPLSSRLTRARTILNKYKTRR